MKRWRRAIEAGRNGKKEILDEFVKVTGFHRKHAIRVLKKSPRPESCEPRQRARIYNEAVREALTMVWEAADRICGKRLCQVITGLIEAMERHGHLSLDPTVTESLLSMSAATMDRLLAVVRDTAKQGRRRSSINNTALRKSIAVRTFGDWNDPAPGFMEMDMVVHCGKSTVGSYVHSLVLTDIASGWTEAIAMVVREQTLVTESVSEVRSSCRSRFAGWMWTTTARLSTTRWWTIAGTTKSNLPDVALIRRTTKLGSSRRTAR